MAKVGVAPMAKNGSPTNSSQIDKRLENLEKQMEKVVKMLEVITINTDKSVPSSPVEAYHQQTALSQVAQVSSDILNCSLCVCVCGGGHFHKITKNLRLPAISNEIIIYAYQFNFIVSCSCISLFSFPFLIIIQRRKSMTGLPVSLPGHAPSENILSTPISAAVPYVRV